MRTRDERGTVLPVMAALVTVLLLIAAMAVDLGMQRSARRDMQALADVVALDLARLLDGRTAVDIRNGTDGKTPLEDAKSASLARNKDTILGEDPTACTEGACLRAYLVEVDESGNYLTARGVPQEVADDVAPNGVVVVATTEVGFAFSGLVGVGEGGASRTALGVADSSACFQLGSYAASINPSSSDLFADLLKPILGASTLTLVGYNGLASTKLSLLDLISAPSIGVGTVDELLALPSLTVGDLFLASAYVLTGQGKIAEAEVFTSAATSVVAPVVLDFNDILAIDGASDAVLETKFNALDLLIGTALLANGENLLNVDNLQAKLSSVGVTSDTELKIIEKARRWCTGDQGDGAETSQVSFKSTIKIQPDNSPLIQTAKTKLRLVDFSTGQPSNDVYLSLNASLAGAHAVLTDASCDPDVFDIDVWTDLLTASLTGTAHVGGTIDGTVDLGLLGTASVNVPVQFGVTISASMFQPAATEPTHVQLSYPPLVYGEYVAVGSDDPVLPAVSVTMTAGTLDIEPVTVEVDTALGTVEVAVSTALLEGVVNPVITNLFSPTGALVTRFVPIVQPVVDKINGILAELNAALGINLAGADVYGMEPMLCEEPRLSG